MPPMLRLEIIMDETGGLTVGGSIENKLIALGLLECAKETLIDHHKTLQNRIVAPKPTDISLVTK